MYKVTKNIILQQIDGSLMGFNPEKSFLYNFNETATFIFKKIKSGWKEDRIVGAITKKYEVPLLTAKKDVKTIIKELVKNKIIYSTISK